MNEIKESNFEEDDIKLVDVTTSYEDTHHISYYDEEHSVKWVNPKEIQARKKSELLQKKKKERRKKNKMASKSRKINRK